MTDQYTNKTRRQKQEAISLFASRRINDEIAYRLVGWIEQAAKSEVERQLPQTTAKSLAEFVRTHESEIRALPLRAA